MTREEQIAALEQKIKELSAQIDQLDAASDASTSASQAARLSAQSASLQATRQALEDALSNLQGSAQAFALARGVTDASAKKMLEVHDKASVKDLTGVASNTNKRAKELLKTVKVPKPKRK